jgi:hypothetical protein
MIPSRNNASHAPRSGTVRWLGFIAALSLFALHSRAADQLYDNGPPDHANGRDMTHWLQADDFAVTRGARVELIKFWDFESAGDLDSTIFWQIYANADNEAPGLLVASGTSPLNSHVATGNSTFGFAEYVNELSIGGVTLPPGSYWLALHNGPLSNDSSAKNVFWENTSRVGLRPAYRKTTPYIEPWVSTAFPGFPSDYAFNLSGTPLPRVTSVSFASATAKIAFTTTVGASYRLEYTNNLTDPTWQPMSGAENISGTGSVVEVADPDANAKNLPRRFYRVVLL